MKRYELIRDTREFEKSELHQIKGLCAFFSEGAEVIKTFDTALEALEALKGYKSDICKVGNAITCYCVEQYYIEESECDEEGEWIDGGDILDYTPLEINLTVNYEDIATYDSYTAARAAYDALEDAEDEDDNNLEEVKAYISPFASKIMLVKR